MSIHEQLGITTDCQIVCNYKSSSRLVEETRRRVNYKKNNTLADCVGAKRMQVETKKMIIFVNWNWTIQETECDNSSTAIAWARVRRAPFTRLQSLVVCMRMMNSLGKWSWPAAKEATTEPSSFTSRTWMGLHKHNTEHKHHLSKHAHTSAMVNRILQQQIPEKDAWH